MTAKDYLQSKKPAPFMGGKLTVSKSSFYNDCALNSYSHSDCSSAFIPQERFASKKGRVSDKILALFFGTNIFIIHWLVIVLALNVIFQLPSMFSLALLIILILSQYLINVYSFFFTIQAQDFLWKIRHLLYPLNCINNKKVFLPNGKSIISFYTHQSLALRFYRSGEFDSFFDGLEAELKQPQTLKQYLGCLLKAGQYWQYRFYFKEAPKTGNLRIEVV